MDLARRLDSLVATGHGVLRAVKEAYGAIIWRMRQQEAGNLRDKNLLRKTKRDRGQAFF